MSYHLAYPQQWIAAGRVTIDPHLAYPLYTLTWQALLGLALMTGSTSLAHLLTWLTGVLAAWCIPLFLERLGVAPGIGRVARLAFLVTPLVLSILDVAMLDVPIMCFLTVAVYALVMLGDDREAGAAQVVPAALCAAAFVSLKVTNVLYLPLFLGLAALRLPRRTLMAYAGACLAAGCIWYVRNWVVSGDPFTPLVAHALGRPAPYWSVDDMRAQATDLRRGLGYTPGALLALPLRLLESTVDGRLRGAPLLGYALILPLSPLLLARRREVCGREVIAATWFAVLVWIATTYLIRYAYWIPLGIVSAALVVDHVVRYLPQRWRRLDWVVAALVLIGPTPSAMRYLKDAFHDPIPIDPTARRAFAFDGCADACAFGAVLARARPAARLYTVLAPMTYYWQQASFRVVSGAFHPGGFLEFDAALKAGRLKAFLETTGADYVVLDDRYAAFVFGSAPKPVAEQLRDALGPPLWSDSAQAVYALR